MKTFLARSLAALVLAVLGACTTSPWYPLQFGPAPVEVAVGANAVAGSQARLLVSVLGVARASQTQPDQVLVRLRLENLGNVAVDVPEDALSLVSADLAPFGKPKVAPPKLRIEPTHDGTLDASFPFPAGRTFEQIDWSGLNLRVAVEFAGTRVTTGASFSHVVPVYAPEPNVTFGFGVGYHAH